MPFTVIPIVNTSPLREVVPVNGGVSRGVVSRLRGASSQCNISRNGAYYKSSSGAVPRNLGKPARRASIYRLHHGASQINASSYRDTRSRYSRPWRIIYRENKRERERETYAVPSAIARTRVAQNTRFSPVTGIYPSRASSSICMYGDMYDLDSPGTRSGFAPLRSEIAVTVR